MKAVIFLIAILLTLSACKKDSATQPPKFEGITMTDAVGAFYGPIDSTDWTLDNNWTNAEKNLFSDYNNYVDATNLNTGEIIYPAFPNPKQQTNFVTVAIDKEAATEIKMRVIDYQWKTFISLDSTYLPQLIFDLSSAPTNNDSLVRVYYMLVRNDSCFLRGHGDLSLKR